MMSFRSSPSSAPRPGLPAAAISARLADPWEGDLLRTVHIAPWTLRLGAL